MSLIMSRISKNNINLFTYGKHSYEIEVQDKTYIHWAKEIKT